MVDVIARPIPENFDPTAATATGDELAALRERLHTAAAAGEKVDAPGKQTFSTVVGVDTAPPVKGVEEQPVPPIPEGGLEKFYDPKTGAYNWEAHAKEAEFRARMAKGKQKAKQQETSAEKTAEEAVSAAGLDWDVLAEKVRTIGDLDDEDYEALNNIGIPPEIVDEYLMGVKALQEVTRQQVYAKTGGKEGLNRLFDWARQNLSEAEITAYDQMLQSPQWPVAIDALIARSGFRPVQQPTLVRPDTGGSVTGDIYRSEEERQADFRDPRYKTSEEFRRMVYEKMMRTERVKGGAQRPAWHYQFTV